METKFWLKFKPTIEKHQIPTVFLITSKHTYFSYFVRDLPYVYVRMYIIEFDNVNRYSMLFLHCSRGTTIRYQSNICSENRNRSNVFVCAKRFHFFSTPSLTRRRPKLDRGSIIYRHRVQLYETQGSVILFSIQSRRAGQVCAFRVSHISLISLIIPIEFQRTIVYHEVCNDDETPVFGVSRD